MTATRHSQPAADETSVLTAAAEHEPNALLRLNARYLGPLTAFADAQGAHDPEAVANQALFDGIEAIPSLRSQTEPAFRSYLYRCVVNRVRSEHRRRSVTTVHLDPERHASHEPSITFLDEESGWLPQALDSLSERQRLVVIERFQRGSTIAETAHRLETTPDAVKNLQVRALTGIRRWLLAAGLAAVVIVALIVGVALSQRDQLIEPADPDPPVERAPLSKQIGPGPTPDVSVRDGRVALTDPAGNGVTTPPGPTEPGGVDAAAVSPGTSTGDGAITDSGATPGPGTSVSPDTASSGSAPAPAASSPTTTATTTADAGGPGAPESNGAATTTTVGQSSGPGEGQGPGRGQGPGKGDGKGKGAGKGDGKGKGPGKGDGKGKGKGAGKGDGPGKGKGNGPRQGRR
ncbi:MAG: sigma-70 family RNA polymerase sigma factor [Actinomycetota bacterium]